MKTIIYIDGFNFYKSSLTKTSYKWVDLYQLFFSKIIRPVHPHSDVVKIKFFTAKVKGSFCKNSDSPKRQHAYLLAIEKHRPGLVDVIEGQHSVVQINGRLIKPEDNSHYNDWVTVEKMEEKKTDVNIALHMYRDCSLDLCEQVVLVSNDSDLSPVIEHIRNDFPEITRGIIIPSKDRRSESLIEHASWKRLGIREEELQCSLLPKIIEYQTGNKLKTKQIRRPEGW